MAVLEGAATPAGAVLGLWATATAGPAALLVKDDMPGAALLMSSASGPSPRLARRDTSSCPIRLRCTACCLWVSNTTQTEPKGQGLPGCKYHTFLLQEHSLLA